MSSSIVLCSAFSRALASRLVVRSTAQARYPSTPAHPYAYVPGGRESRCSRILEATEGPVRDNTVLGLLANLKGGTLNDPTTFPAPSPIHGSYHWAFERFLSAALVSSSSSPVGATTPSWMAFLELPSLCTVISAYVQCLVPGSSLTEIQFDSCVVDYFHPRKFPVIGRIATWALRSATVATLVGVHQFNTNDIGLTELIAKA